MVSEHSNTSAFQLILFGLGEKGYKNGEEKK